MIITYTLNFMDKNALSYSANFGLTTDNVCDYGMPPYFPIPFDLALTTT